MAMETKPLVQDEVVYQWFSAGLWYLQCIKDGDTTLSRWTIDIARPQHLKLSNTDLLLIQEKHFYLVYYFEYIGKNDSI